MRLQENIATVLFGHVKKIHRDLEIDCVNKIMRPQGGLVKIRMLVLTNTITNIVTSPKQLEYTTYGLWPPVGITRLLPCQLTS